MQNAKRDAECHRLEFVWVAAIAQIVFVILFAFLADYGDGGAMLLDSSKYDALM